MPEISSTLYIISERSCSPLPTLPTDFISEIKLCLNI